MKPVDVAMTHLKRVLVFPFFKFPLLFLSHILHHYCSYIILLGPYLLDEQTACMYKIKPDQVLVQEVNKYTEL